MIVKDVKRLIAVALMLALFGGACSSETPIEPAALQEDAPVEQQDASDRADEPGDVAVDEDTDIPQDQLGVDARDESSAVHDSAGDVKGPIPPKLPWKPEVPVKATVSPRCVHPGDTVTLTVTTKPEAAVAYQAVYSDNKGGAEPPTGGGYGGNDKGNTESAGEYTSSWVVAPHAPAGPARVDVIIAWAAKKEAKWGYDGPKFEVADAPDGSC